MRMPVNVHGLAAGMISFVAISKRDRHSSVLPAIVKLAQKNCDFSRPFQTP